MPTARDALARWSVLANLKAGEPVFRKVSNMGEIGAKHLTDRSIARIVKARMARFYRIKGNTDAEADALADAFSGHSMRAGYATTAGVHDLPGYRIKERMRHKSMDTTLYPLRSAVDEIRAKGDRVLEAQHTREAECTSAVVPAARTDIAL